MQSYFLLLLITNRHLLRLVVITVIIIFSNSADVISVTYLLNSVTYWHLNITPNVRRMNWSYYSFKFSLSSDIIVTSSVHEGSPYMSYVLCLSKKLTAVSLHLRLFICCICRKGAVPVFRSTLREWVRSVWPSGQPQSWTLLFHCTVCSVFPHLRLTNIWEPSISHVHSLNLILSLCGADLFPWHLNSSSSHS